MKYKTKHLKKAMPFLIDECFPKTLEVGKSYQISYDFHPISKDTGWVNYVSVKEIP